MSLGGRDTVSPEVPKVFEVPKKKEVPPKAKAAVKEKPPSQAPHTMSNDELMREAERLGVITYRKDRFELGRDITLARAREREEGQLQPTPPRMNGQSLNPVSPNSGARMRSAYSLMDGSLTDGSGSMRA